MEALKFECKKCGYEWFPRTEQPYKCPRCQSPLNPKRKAEGLTVTSHEPNSLSHSDLDRKERR